MATSWFTVEKFDEDTYAISEYKHWEKTHSYLILGSCMAGLIDTGLGIGNIKEIIKELTTLPITVISTHVHWDHIGGHDLFNNISVHKNDVEWLRKGIPISLDNIKKNLVKDVDRKELPTAFDVDSYRLYQGEPSHILDDNETISLGNRELQVIHTPGHSPGHLCLYERERGYLFTGDLIYKGTLYAYYPSTNPQQFYQSILKISKLKYVNKIFPGHNELNIKSGLINKVQQAFAQLNEKNLLHHNSGLHEYQDFKIKL